MNKEDMQKIVDKVIEEIMLQMPTVIGNLMKNHAMLNKLNHEFYTKFPSFQKHKDVVVSVIEQVEGSDLSLKYEDILKKATPIIKERIKLCTDLDMDVNKTPSIPIKINFDMSGNGLI